MHAEKRDEEKSLDDVIHSAKKSDIITLYYIVEYFKSRDYKIKFCASKHFAISPLFIDEIKLNDDTIEIVLNFNTFFGYRGLFQDYLHEVFFYKRETSMPDFLNIFYNRMIELFFNAKKVFYPYFSKPMYTMMYRSLSGLVGEKDLLFLRYGTFFISNPKSKSATEALATAFSGIRARIDEFTGVRTKYDDDLQAKLFEDVFLNGEKHLGVKYESGEAQFDIILYPETQADLVWIFNKENVRNLRTLICKFINTRLEFRLLVHWKKARRCILGSSGYGVEYLGHSSFLTLKEGSVDSFFKLRE